MKEQKFTSAGTSINSTTVPALFKKVTFQNSDTIFDYGCGKYKEIIADFLSCDYFGYDKFNQPESVNNAFIRAAKVTPNRVFTCCNVLNVIDSDDVVQSIIDYATANFSRIYFQIYEGNKSGVSKITKSGTCYQRNTKTADYLKHFHFPVSTFQIKISGNIITMIRKEV